MKNFRLKLISALYLLAISASTAFARHGSIVPRCDPVAKVGSPERCNLCHFLDLGKHITEFLIEAAVVLAAIFITWGGIVIMTAGGSPERFSKGRQILTISVIGVAVALGAWLIIGTALNILSGGNPLPWNEIKCS